MAFYHTNMQKVEEKLGANIVKLMLDSARNGDISDEQMASIADKLGRDLDGPNVIFGGHKRRFERDKQAKSDILLKGIFSDWWMAQLYDLPYEKVLSKIGKIFQDPDVDLRPLAKKLMDATGGKQGPQQTGDKQKIKCPEFRHSLLLCRGEGRGRGSYCSTV